MSDVDLVATQLGRPPRAFLRVVTRCPWGMPVVTEQDPYGADGEPFPTTYYLTCRHLVSAIARVEAAGGVERWTEAIERDPALMESLVEATARQVEIRVALAADRRGRDQGASLETGIGGSRRPARLKCLHAHVAYALANPGYLIGEGVLAELPVPWPDRCCSAG